MFKFAPIVLLAAFLLAGDSHGFAVCSDARRVLDSSLTSLYSKNGKGDSDNHQAAYAVGTFVEFEEKKRTHVGKITEAEHKTNGSVRYHINDSEGKTYDVADKAVNYAMPCPNSPGQATKLFNEFCAAYEMDEKAIAGKIDVSTDLLEMAWEESADDDLGPESVDTSDHLITPNGLIEMVHSHSASAIEKYLAWKLLRTEMAHVFFKEIKDHGRVVAFKAKARKAVEAAKQAFCQSHQDSDLCLV